MAWLLAVLTGAPVFCQRPPVETFTVDQGLPSAQIQVLAQDREGRLWIANRGGVTSYDGDTFETLTSANGLPLMRIQSLAVPPEGTETGERLFALTYDAPVIYALVDDTWHLVAQAPQLGREDRGTAFLALARSGPRDFLVGTGESGVLRWMGPHRPPVVSAARTTGSSAEIVPAGAEREPMGLWTRIEMPAGLPQAITGLAQLGSRVYVAGQHGLCRWDGGRRMDCAPRSLSPHLARPVVSLAVEPGSPAGSATSRPGEGNSGRLWLRGTDWLGWLGGDGLQVVVDPLPFMGRRDAPWSALAVGPHGGVYFGSPDRLFYLGPGQPRPRPLGRRDGLVAEGATAVMMDRESNVWIGGMRGLSRIGPRRLMTFDSQQGLLDNEVSAVLELSRDRLLLGHNVGLTILHDPYTEPRAETIRIPAPAHFEGMVGSRVLDMSLAEDGSVWIAAQRAGVLRWVPGGEPQPVVGVVPACENAFSVEHDHAGGVWVTCARRLIRCSSSGELCTELSATLSPEGHLLLRRAVTVVDGTLYLATRQGLVSRESDGNWWQAQGPTDEANNLYDVLDEGADGIWVATASGLYQVVGDAENGRRLVASVRPRISRPTYALLRDGLGRLWIATDDGARIWDGQELRTLSVHHGLAGRELNRAALVEGRDSRIWMGTDQGLSLYDPVFDRPAMPAPHVEIHGVEIDGRWMELDSRPLGRGGSVTEVPADPVAELAHHQNTLVFRFGAVSLRRDDPLLYRFRLEGFDDSWSSPQPLPGATVRYTGLRPGAYRFQLMAGRAGREWSSPVTSPRLRIRRPWWRQRFFYLATGLISVLAISLAHGLRTRSIRRRNQRLEELNLQLEESVHEVRRIARERQGLITELEERNTELQRFLYSVSHDLKNQVVTIRGFAGHLVNDLEAQRPRRALTDARRVVRAADTLGRLLEDLVELFRVGRTVESQTRVDLEELVREVEITMADAFVERRATLEITADLPTVMVERARFSQLFEILFDNALSFARPGVRPRIAIGGWRTETSEIVTVSDNGIGIDPRYHERVFHLFERLDPEIEGTGVGLTLARRIVELHGGEIWVESDGPGQGTTVCFTLDTIQASERSRSFER